MWQPPASAPPDSIEQEELRGISRTVAAIHWLLLILVLVYLMFGGALYMAKQNGRNRTVKFRAAAA